jgi:hypothetical protein
MPEPIGYLLPKDVEHLRKGTDHNRTAFVYAEPQGDWTFPIYASAPVAAQGEAVLKGEELARFLMRSAGLPTKDEPSDQEPSAQSVTVDGVRFDFAYLSVLAKAPIGTLIRVADREGDGLVLVNESQPIPADSGAREAFVLMPVEPTKAMIEAGLLDDDSPDGFVNMDAAYRRMLDAHPSAPQRPSDDELWDQTLQERDDYHEWADKLANAIASHFGVEIGEHSNLNEPWANALEAIEAAHEPSAPNDEAREALKELLRLYDWRFVLADREKAEGDEAFQRETSKLLRQYGEEKKVAWVNARRVLGDK